MRDYIFIVTDAKGKTSEITVRAETIGYAWLELVTLPEICESKILAKKIELK